MRFEQYLKEDDFGFLGCYQLVDDLNEELAQKDFEMLQRLGRKAGIKVTRSKTLQGQVGRAGKGVWELFKMTMQYSFHADIRDKEALKKLEADIKAQFKKLKIEDVTSFMVNIDRSFLGITSIPRHILQNLLGIRIGTYDNWVSDGDYVLRQIEKMYPVLDRLGASEEKEVLQRVYANIKRLSGAK